MARTDGLPSGRAVALDGRVRLWGDATLMLGGSPWGVVRLAPSARDFARRLALAGADGEVPSGAVEVRVANLLLTRGLVHPVAASHTQTPDPSVSVEVVVPAYEQPELLGECLASLRAASPDLRVIVVDDASADRAVAESARAHGATVIRHPTNRGPAAARNTGLRASGASVVVFVDSDCTVTAGWLEPLLAHFDDPRVGAVAPRIRSQSPGRGLISRFQDAHSALDMGPRAELVRYGAAVGFVPSATIAIRRSALDGMAFAEHLRLGEDVDLVWRLAQSGWLVRYEPGSRVWHRVRPTGRGWAGRLFDYGTSAAELDMRYPGRLTPARISGWNITVAGLLLSRRPSARVRVPMAAAIMGVSWGLLARALRSSAIDPRVSARVVARAVLSDTTATGHLLRREWWPVGWLAIAAALRHRTAAAAAAAAMLIPLMREWRARQPAVDLPRYLALRLIEDAAYGTGVIVGAVRRHRPAVLLPRVRLPYLPRRRR